MSQWNLMLITLLYTTIAIVQIKHEKRLKTFTVDVKPLKMTRTSSGSDFMATDSTTMIEEVSNEDSSSDDADDFDQPWV